MPSSTLAWRSPPATPRSSGFLAATTTPPDRISARLTVHRQHQCLARPPLTQISRRQFLRWLATLGAASATVAGYGVLFEPLMRLKIARYDLRPKAWPPGFTLTIAAVADLHACRP